MSDFKPGELVDIEIKSVRVETISAARITIEDGDGELWVLPPHALITRVNPPEWPPQRADLWRDRNGSLWVALATGQDDRCVLREPHFRGDDFNPAVAADHYGPFVLVHREQDKDGGETNDGRAAG